MRNNMRAERVRLGLTAQQVADKLGVHVNAVLKWERGESEPLGENLINLGKLYKCSPEYLLDQTLETNKELIVSNSPKTIS